MMHADAKHPNCAYKWMEHSLEPEGAGRRRRLVRLGAGGAGRLQGQRAPDRHRLRHQRLRQFRQDLVLEDADGEMRRRKAAACPTRWATDYIAIIGK